MRKILSIFLLGSFGISCSSSISQQETNKQNISLTKQDSTLQFEWAINFGKSYNVIGSTIQTDHEGNLYVASTFYNTVDFDPGVNEYKMTASGNEDGAGYILKLDSLGAFIWAKQINNADIMDLAVGNSGNIYIIGDIIGDADLNPGNEELNVSTDGYRHMYILKLNKFGDYIWAKNIGGEGEIKSKSICIDKDENFYVKGHFTGKIDFSPGNGKNIITSEPKISSMVYDVFVSKFTSTGQVEWVKNHKSEGTDYLFEKSIVIDKNHNVYFCGVYNEAKDINSRHDDENNLSNNHTSIYVSKLDNNGNLIWTKLFGNEYSHSPSISSDSKSNIIITGCLRQEGDFDPGAGQFILDSKGKHDAFVLKIDSNSNFIWAKNYGGINDDFPGCIATDSMDNIYIIGSFLDSMYDSDNNFLINTKSENHDIFISKIDGNGKLIWIEKIGNNEFSTGNYISIDKKNNVFFTCSIEGKLNVGSSIKEINTFEESVLILKLSGDKN